MSAECSKSSLEANCFQLLVHQAIGFGPSIELIYTLGTGAFDVTVPFHFFIAQTFEFSPWRVIPSFLALRRI